MICTKCGNWFRDPNDDSKSPEYCPDCNRVASDNTTRIVRGLGLVTPTEHEKSQIKKILLRYGKRGDVKHHGDCEFFTVRVCTCGLLHDLLPVSGAIVLNIFPAYVEHADAHIRAVEKLRELERPQ